MRVERGLDRLAQRLRVPRAGHEVEVERRVHLVRAQVPGEPLPVREPDLAHEHARLVVRVGDGAPAAVDVVQLVAVDVRVLARAGVVRDLGQRRVLDELRRRVDADARGAAVEPEPQDVLVLAAHVGVVPVEVGLLGREHVEVPLAGRTVGVRRARPRAALELRDPVGRDLRPVLAPARVEPEALALGRAGAGREGRAEPLVLGRDVVRDDVDDRADAERAGLRDELLGLGERAELRVDRAVVGDVVAAVRERGHVPGGEPDRVDAEVAQVAEALAHACEVTGPVAVPVREAAHVHLVDHGAAPPVGRRGRRPCRRRGGRVGGRRAVGGSGVVVAHRVLFRECVAGGRGGRPVGRRTAFDAVRDSPGMVPGRPSCTGCRPRRRA